VLMRDLPTDAQLRALAYVHFCNNWFHYTMLAWLPTYFSETLDLNLSQAAQARSWVFNTKGAKSCFIVSF